MTSMHVRRGFGAAVVAGVLALVVGCVPEPDPGGGITTTTFATTSTTEGTTTTSTTTTQGTTTTTSTAPTTTIPGGTTPLGGVVQAAVGTAHACAVTAPGYVFCWGWNADGQLGNGSAVSSSSPVQALLPGPAAQVATGDFHTCALLDDGRVFCWGDNSAGQLGRPTPTAASARTPGEVTGGALPTEIGGIAAGANHSCAVSLDRDAACWGQNWFGQLGDNDGFDPSGGPGETQPAPVAVGGGSAIFEAAAGGDDHTCFTVPDYLLSEPWVACTGRNTDGQVGYATTGDSEPIRPVLTAPGTALLAVEAVAVGSNFACARRADSFVWCWGANASGTLGNGTTTSSSVAVATGITGDSLGAGERSACVTGPLRCWGDNRYGQLGTGTVSAPPASVFSTSQSVAGPAADAVRVDVGDDVACAVLPDATVRCWGRNHRGQLGADTTVAESATPLEVTFH